MISILEADMDGLQWELKKLTQKNREDSIGTQTARHQALDLMARQLKDMGYRNMRVDSLKPRHVEALLKRWKEEGLSTGTVKNRMSHLRWWAEKMGKHSLIPNDNAKLGIENRVYVQEQGKQTSLDPEKLAQIKDAHLRLSLEMQAQFGLRREEAMKFQPAYAVRDHHIHLKPSWTKGGRARDIPIRTTAQRELLERVRQLAGTGSLIPAGRSYVFQKNLYERETRAAGIADGDRKAHGLRHGYAQERYLELTGWKAPHAGGPRREELTPEQREADLAARLVISQEMGHNREEVTAVYLGR
jgi:site-specific recombinase XerC